MSETSVVSGFVPDVVDRPADRLLEAMAIVPDQLRTAIADVDATPAATDVVMRVNRVVIYDNRDPGGADVSLLTVVADDLAPTPFELKLTSYQDIRDGDELMLGPAGVTIYQNDPQGSLPRFLEFRVLVIESDSEIRETGGLIDELAKSEEYKKIRDGLIALGGASGGSAALIVASVDLAVQLIGRALRKNRDDQLFYVAGSYNRRIDGLGVWRGPVVQSTRYAQVTYQVHEA